MGHTHAEVAAKLSKTLVDNVVKAPKRFVSKEGEEMWYYFVKDTCTEWCKKAHKALIDSGEFAAIQIPTKFTKTEPFNGIVISVLSSSDSDTGRSKAILALGLGKAESSDFKSGSLEDLEEWSKDSSKKKAEALGDLLDDEFKDIELEPAAPVVKDDFDL